MANRSSLISRLDVTSVRGLADRQLRFAADPFDSRNRRVSILVKNPLLTTKQGGEAAQHDEAKPSADPAAPAH